MPAEESGKQGGRRKIQWVSVVSCKSEMREDGGGMDWEFGISKCKLLYIEWINNKFLLYSTGSYIKYPIINHNGKEYEKRMYKYV